MMTNLVGAGFGRATSLLAAAMAAAGSSILSPSDAGGSSFAISNNFEGGKFVGHVRDRSRYMPHQGKRECARRRRQMGLE